MLQSSNEIDSVRDLVMARRRDAEWEKVDQRLREYARYRSSLDAAEAFDLVRAEQMKNLENMKLPLDLDYSAITTISYEAREKLTRFRPQTLGQAQRIDGVRPVDCSALLIHLKKNTPIPRPFPTL